MIGEMLVAIGFAIGLYAIYELIFFLFDNKEESR